MTAILAAGLLLAQWTTPTGDDTLTGRATYMAPSVMEQVLTNRGISLPPGTVAVALNRAGDLGRRVWLTWPNGTVDAGLVVDCAGRGRHYEEREAAKPPLIAEVSAEVAGLRGFYLLGPMRVTVSFVEPWPEPEGAN